MHISIIFTIFNIDRLISISLNSHASHQGPSSNDVSSSAYEDIIEIKKLLKKNLMFHDMKFLQNEVDLQEEELDKSSEDHEFNERRGFYSSPPYKPTYHYEPPAYHPPPPPPAYKAVYEVSVSLQGFKRKGQWSFFFPNLSIFDRLPEKKVLSLIYFLQRE